MWSGQVQTNPRTPLHDRKRETSGIKVVIAKIPRRKISSEISTGHWTGVAGVQDYISGLFTTVHADKHGDCIIELLLTKYGLIGNVFLIRRN